MSFKELGLDENILKALSILDYKEPLPVQERVIPYMLDTMNLIVKSKTGSGKTASFALPIIQKMEIDEKLPQALVLVPTRELSLQIKEEFDKLGSFKKIKTISITGKQPFKFQKEDLQQRTHVVIGTPGRLLDHLKQNTLNVDKVKYVILDEADEMLNLNFIEDIRSIFAFLSSNPATCIFSETYPEGIQNLSKEFLKDPKMIEMEGNVKIDEYFYSVKETLKNEILYQCIGKYKWDSLIVFGKTQARVEAIYTYLKDKDVSCNRIHAGLMQDERFSCIKDFKKGAFRVLIATDVAARGLDIMKVDCIINYDMPSPMAFYTHRIGRSGRVNEKGMAITFINEYDNNHVQQLKEYLHKEIPVEPFIPYTISKQDKEIISKSTKIVENKAKELKKGRMTLYLNGGKNKKIRPGDIVGAICQIETVSMEDIGIIQVQDHQSYVEILNDKGKLVLKQLQNLTIKNKKLKIQEAI